jgi:hypothetical protein
MKPIPPETKILYDKALVKKDESSATISLKMQIIT